MSGLQFLYSFQESLVTFVALFFLIIIFNFYILPSFVKFKSAKKYISSL